MATSQIQTGKILSLGLIGSQMFWETLDISNNPECNIFPRGLRYLRVLIAVFARWHLRTVKTLRSSSPREGGTQQRYIRGPTHHPFIYHL